MATWKKVLVEDADIQVGDITATLGNVTGIGDANLTVNLVTSTTNGATSGDLGVASVTFGTAAFDAASSFATAAQGGLADSALQTADFAADIVSGSTGGIAVTDGNNKVLGADSADISLDLDVSSIANTITSVASTDLIPLQDVTDNATKKATVANIIAAVSSGVTTFNAGRNLTEADGDTEGTIDLDLDVNLVQVNTIKATEGSGTDAAGTSLQLHGGAGTGTGTGGGIRLKVADGSTTGSTLNTYATAVQVNDDKTTDFNEKISITASADGTAIDAGDLDIINVDDLKIDRLLAHDNANLEIAFPAVTGGGVISVGDNLASALVLKQNAAEYMLVKTTNGAEEVKIGHGVSGTAITIGHSTSEVTIGDNLTVTGDLTVQGDTTTVNTANLLVEDTFIALNSGGSTNVDAGIVFTGLANKVFGWDQSQESGRFGVDYAGGDASVSGGGFSPDAWVSTVHTAAGDDTNATAALAQIGNMYINSSNQDIYIYS